MIKDICTSTLGDGAFGGTIALSSATPDSEPGLELTGSYGAYNTRHMGGKFSTGTILNNLIIDGAYNQTQTDGFMHGTKGNSGSYYGGLLWMPSDNVMLRYRNIGNFEMTGQAWSGATAGDDNKSLMDGTYGTKTGIKTYQDMYDKGLGQYNSLYEAIQYDDNGKFLIDDNGKYVAARYMMKDGTYWDRTTDNFWQDHNILSLSWTQNEQLTTSITLHYTYGYGYYNEFRPNNKLEKYGLSFTDGQGNEVKKSDFVRKKGLEQHTYGAIWNNNISLGDLNIRAGLSMQQFKGNNFGHITYVGNDELEAAILADGKYTYYDSDAKKTDNSTFVKAIYNLTPQISLSADYQSRHVKYTTDGYNDKYIKDDDGIHKHMLDIDKEYMFDNFKFGVNWQKNGHNVYALAAYGNREPERNNFTDNGKYPAPDPESMLDIEAGYNYTSDSWYAGFIEMTRS